MTLADLLDLLTQLTFLWVAGSTLYNWGKQRDQARFDIALVFVSLALAISVLNLQRVLPDQATLLSVIFFLLILTQPYLLLQVAHYFHPIPNNIRRAALIGLLVVAASIFLSSVAPILVVALLILYFAVFQGYATLLLVRGARTIPGITGKRLGLASAGSGLFVLVFLATFLILLMGLIGAGTPAMEAYFDPLIQILAILSGLTYFFGFSPPRPLRRLWQFNELHHFLQQVRQPSESRGMVLDELAGAALRTVGGIAALIVRCDPAGQHLTLELSGKPPVVISDQHGPGRNGRIWYERPARMEHVPGETWPEINRWAGEVLARTLFIVPIRSPLRPWGLLVLALRYAPLFAQDDLELLTLIAEQSAIPLDYAPTVEELQVTNRSLEQRIVERTALLEKINRDLELQIADRKRAEGNLQKSEARYLSTLDTMMEGCQVIGFDWRYRYVNDAAARQGRQTREELIGRTMMEAYPGIEASAMYLTLQRCMQDRAPHQMENKFSYPDGSKGWFELSIQPVPEGVFILSVDISERKSAELALLESEARKAAILETALDCIITVDQHGRVLEFNPAAEDTFGYTTGNVLGRDMAELLFPETMGARIRREFEYYLATGGNMLLDKRIELTGMRSDGGEFPMEMTMARVTNSDPPVFTVFMRDITDRKLVEEAMREREARYRFIFESTPVAIWEEDFTEVQKTIEDLKSQGITDLRRHLAEQAELTRQIMASVRVLDVNQQSLVMFGAAGKEELKQSLDRIFLPETLPLFIEEAAALAEGQSYFEGETTVQTLQGEKRDILVTIHFPEAGGRLDHTLVSMIDITARRQAEVSVLRSQTQLAGIINSAMDAIISIDENQRILIFNPAAEKMFQRFADKVIGKPLTLLIPERFHALHEKDVRAFGRSSVTKRTMGRLDAVQGLRLNGQEFPMEASISQIEIRGRKIYTAILRDITERKQAEDELNRLNNDLEKRVAERTSQLASAIRELEAFSYSVSHDLRAPLRSIDGFSQALLEDFSDQIPAEGRGHLDRVRAAAQRMAVLIDDLLALSRVTRTPVERKPVDLSALAGKILTELQLEQPGRQVSVSIAPGLTVNGDENLLRIALYNLLSNAWKFTSKKDSALIEFGAQDGTGERVFFVRDNGSGFDMTYVHKLFGAFQRLHSSDDFPGTGIGLATVQRIFTKHGGRVWAEGERDKGATFYFKL